MIATGCLSNSDSNEGSPAPVATPAPPQASPAPEPAPLFGMHPSKPKWVEVPDEASRNGALWWRNVPDVIGDSSLVAESSSGRPLSNIRRADYAGAEACEPCHAKNYAGWYQHAHRRMNALADTENVEGDFSGGARARIEYMGGVGTFFMAGDAYRMELVKGDHRRLFDVSRTIGSRFLQYYVGRQLEGPEPTNDKLYRLEYVLPFGYWIDQRQWVPLVHVAGHGMEPDDPYIQPPRKAYDPTCSSCHTTPPAGNWMIGQIGAARVEAHAPHPISMFASAYLAEEHPQIQARVMGRVGERISPFDPQGARLALAYVNSLPTRKYAVNLGIS